MHDVFTLLHLNKWHTYALHNPAAIATNILYQVARAAATTTVPTTNIYYIYNRHTFI